MKSQRDDIEIIDSVLLTLIQPGMELETIQFDEDHHGLDSVWLTVSLTGIEDNYKALATTTKDFNYQATTRLIRAGLHAYPYVRILIKHMPHQANQRSTG